MCSHTDPHKPQNNFFSFLYCIHFTPHPRRFQNNSRDTDGAWLCLRRWVAGPPRLKEARNSGKPICKRQFVFLRCTYSMNGSLIEPWVSNGLPCQARATRALRRAVLGAISRELCPSSPVLGAMFLEPRPKNTILRLSHIALQAHHALCGA